MQEFESAIGTIAWEQEPKGARIRMAGREHALAWAAATGAGVVMLPQGSAPDAPIGAHLVIAPGAQTNYLLRIPLPEGNASADALAATVRENLGVRWHDDLTATSYRRALIPAWSNLPDWFLPAVVLGFVGLSAVFLIVMVILGMGSDDALDISWWQIALGFAVWIAIVAAILGRYKRLWIK